MIYMWLNKKTKEVISDEVMMKSAYLKAEEVAENPDELEYYINYYINYENKYIYIE